MVVRLTDGDLVTDLVLLGDGVILFVVVRLTDGDGVSDRVIDGDRDAERVFVGDPEGLAAVVRVTEGDRVTLRVADGERLTDLLLVGVLEFEKNDGNLIGILGSAVVGNSVGLTGRVGSSVCGIWVKSVGNSVIRRSGIDGYSVFGNSVFGKAVFGMSIGGKLGYSVTGKDGKAGILVAIVGISYVGNTGLVGYSVRGILGTSRVGRAGTERSGNDGKTVVGKIGTESVGSKVGREFTKDAKPRGENDGRAVIEGIT